MSTLISAGQKAISLLNTPSHPARPVAAGRCASEKVDSASRISREDHRYSWLEDHLTRLEGKEARGEYYARL